MQTQIISELVRDAPVGFNPPAAKTAGAPAFRNLRKMGVLADRGISLFK